MNSPHKRPVMRKMFPFDDVIMISGGGGGGGGVFSRVMICKIHFATFAAFERHVLNFEISHETRLLNCRVS